MLRQKKIYLEVKRLTLPITKGRKAEPNGGSNRNMLFMDSGKPYIYSGKAVV